MHPQLTVKRVSGNKKEKKSKTLDPIVLSTEEATLVYEQVHSARIAYKNQKEKNDKIIRVCDGVLKKIEVLILGESPSEKGGTQTKKTKN